MIGGYAPRHAWAGLRRLVHHELKLRADRSWPSFRLVLPESLPRAVKPGFAYTCARRIRAREGWPPLAMPLASPGHTVGIRAGRLHRIRCEPGPSPSPRGEGRRLIRS
jgi:hypothetical protein